MNAPAQIYPGSGNFGPLSVPLKCTSLDGRELFHASAWAQLSSKERVFLCNLAGESVRPGVGDWRDLTNMEREKLRDAAAHVVAFSGKLGGFIR